MASDKFTFCSGTYEKVEEVTGVAGLGLMGTCPVCKEEHAVTTSGNMVRHHRKQCGTMKVEKMG